MIWDDEENKKGAPKKPKDLSAWSIEELKDYIADMKTEITRAEAEIAKKEAHKAAMDGMFKS